MRFLLCLLLACLPASAALTAEQISKLPPPAAGTAQFAGVQKIFEARCVNCHGRGKAKGGFALDTRDTFLKGGDSGPAVVLGKSSGSLLIELVSGLNPDSIMPEKGTKLTAAEVGLLRAWIDQGAKWDNAVSFAKKEPLNLKPRVVALPPGKAKNPIDRLLKLNPAKPVDDRVFARRVYLDTIGLLPTAEELAQFLKRNEKNKRGLLVKELLARNDDYATHWLTFWNDALRNDYRGTGYIDGGRKQITQWLYSALATNKPFDKFVAELINPTPESEGFVKGIVWRGVVNASQTPEMQAAQNISQVFMGVNLKCASCHDSFINDWRLADAYGLASVYSEHPLEMVQCDKPLGKTALVQFIFPELGTIDQSAPKKKRLSRLAEVVTSPENGRLSRTMVNRLWARFFGRGLVEPVDEMDQPAWNQELLDFLAADFTANGFDVKRTITLMLTSHAYALPSVPASEGEKEFVFKGPQVRRLSAEQFLDALGTITGVWNGAAAADIAPTGRNGSALPSKWIWSTTNAHVSAAPGTVTFRKTFKIEKKPDSAAMLMTCDNEFVVSVNGRESGRSVDFGTPTAIDLAKFIKAGENMITVEATNGGQGPNPAGLFALVRLDGQDFGSDASWEFKRGETWSGAQELGAPNEGPWKLGQKLTRLAANLDYATKTRAALVIADPLMLALGRPNREQVMTVRASAATTLQALEMTNGNTLARRLREGADKLAASEDPSTLLDRLYVTALSRKPTRAEREMAREFLGAPLQAAAVEDLLWAVTMLPEFQLIR